jgi:hypothetical protein
MTASDLVEWEEFVKLRGPIGEVRADYRAALIAFHAHAPWRSDEAPEPKLTDFLLWRQDDDAVTTHDLEEGVDWWLTQS